MTAARKADPPLEAWKMRPNVRPTYERGEITVRPHEPALQRECERCGGLLKQQHLRIQPDEAQPKPENERSVWAVLPCERCPLDLGRRA